MFKFKKSEILGVTVIFILLIVMTINNFEISRKNERDVLRNANLGNLAIALERYKADYGQYPLSDDNGKIIACRGENTDTLKDSLGKPVYLDNAKKANVKDLVVCHWGEDYFGDPMDENAPKYIDILPKDPKYDEGYGFRYESDGNYYNLYVSYERNSTIDYSKNVLEKKILCNQKVCNAGRSDGNKIL